MKIRLNLKDGSGTVRLGRRVLPGCWEVFSDRVLFSGKTYELCLKWIQVQRLKKSAHPEG